MGDLDFDAELEGGMKYSYEQFHVLGLILQQKIMVSKGSFPVREAMVDHQWDSIPCKNKLDFVDLWDDIEGDVPGVGMGDEEKRRVNYRRLRRKAQLLSDVLLAIKVINYAPPGDASEIIRLGLLKLDSLEGDDDGDVDEVDDNDVVGGVLG